MRVRYELTPEALQDLNEIWVYIAEDNPDAADRVEASILAACEHLVEFPRAGVDRQELPDRNLRYWTVSRFPNYMIAYRPETEPLQIVAILEGHRDIRRTISSRH